MTSPLGAGAGGRSQHARATSPLLDHASPDAGALRPRERRLAGRGGAPTSRSSPSSRSWRWRSSWSATSPGTSPRPQSNLVDGIEQVLPGMIGPDRGADLARSPSRAPPRPSGCIGAGHADLLRAGLAVGHAHRAPGRLRAPAQPPAQLRRRQAARPGHAGRGRADPAGQRGRHRASSTRFSTGVLDLAGLDHDLSWTVEVVGVVVGMAANTLLFFVLFTVLARPAHPGPGAVAGRAPGLARLRGPQAALELPAGRRPSAARRSRRSGSR